MCMKCDYFFFFYDGRNESLQFWPLHTYVCYAHGSAFLLPVCLRPCVHFVPVGPTGSGEELGGAGTLEPASTCSGTLVKLCDSLTQKVPLSARPSAHLAPVFTTQTARLRRSKTG